MKRILVLYAAGVPFGILLFYLGFKQGLLSQQSVLFYRGIGILIITCVLQWAILCGSSYALWKNQLSMAHGFAATMASLAFCATFLIVVPVSLDRSVSVFLLGYMNQHPEKAYTEQELEQVLIATYVKRYKAIDRRLNEQIISKNVIIDATGHYRLTQNGQNFVALSKYIAPAFQVDMKYLDPISLN